MYCSIEPEATLQKLIVLKENRQNSNERLFKLKKKKNPRQNNGQNTSKHFLLHY